MNTKKVFLTIFFIWLLLLLGFIMVKEFTVASGEKVLLKTRPVDPRDMFRGDYVILDYDISRIDMTEFDTRINFSKNDKIYVQLEKEEKFHVVKDFSDKKFEGLYIKGKVDSAFGNTINVDYGIESYFVPEGEGKELESMRNRGNLSVEVSVDQFGNSVINKLFANDEEVVFG